MPNDEVYKERLAAQAAAGNKDIPDEAIMEMKGIVKLILTISHFHILIH